MATIVDKESATNRVTREVGIRELRDGLSRFLGSVTEGNRIVVTDHGKPIAEIRPLGPYEWLEELAREGRVSRPLAPKTKAPEPLDFGFSLRDYLER